jgi:hypothetical protein
LYLVQKERGYRTVELLHTRVPTIGSYFLDVPVKSLKTMFSISMRDCKFSHQYQVSERKVRLR